MRTVMIESYVMVVITNPFVLASFGTDNARASSAALAQADHLKTAVVAASPQSWAVV